jgi:hypothetical protein
MPIPQGANRYSTIPQAEAIAVAGQLEPIEPVYTKPNTSSPVSDAMQVPSEPTEWKAPVVLRGQDTRGMRYLYADMRQRQPISPLGTGPDLGVAVWSSEFQPNLGSLRDYGFYDLLYRAGYPGFNLGLSFRVPVNPSVGSQAPGSNIHMTSPNRKVIVNVFKRVNAAASMRG